jgi:hypothetical protein
MAGLVPAIHFPEAVQASPGLWKMDGRHEGGHDDRDNPRTRRMSK